MKLAQSVTYSGFEGVSLCGTVSIQSVRAQWLWWESWVWYDHELCLSLGYAGSYHLDKRWGWTWRGQSQSQVWARDSPLLSGQHYPIEGRVRSQVPEAEVLRVKSELAPFPLIVFSLLPALSPLPKKAAVLEQEGLEQAFGMGWGAGCGGPGSSLHSRLLPIRWLCWCQQWLPLPCLDAVSGLSWLCSPQLCTPLGCSSPCPEWSCTTE